MEIGNLSTIAVTLFTATVNVFRVTVNLFTVTVNLFTVTVNLPTMGINLFQLPAEVYDELYYPIKNYRGLSPNYRGERWAYVHFIGGAANYPIIYPEPPLGLHHEACKCVYLRILISEASTNIKYEEKMHIEVSETIFLRLFQ